jgi:dTDP-4-amino-4,6-dideoxygalactose transaminase
LDRLPPTPILRVDQAAQYEAYAAEILAAVEGVLKSGRYVLGPESAAFEAEFAAYLGAENVVAVADGTRAITLALQLAGVGRGTEVITTAFTAVPTIGAILDAGAVPVFADIDPTTWLIDIDKVVEAVTEHTAAIVPVHMFGNVVDIPRLQAALPRAIPIVEDAAQAHGSRLGNRFAGTMGDFGTFSFYPTKNLGGYGDGGAIVCRDPAQAERLRLMRNHGMRGKDHWASSGVNSRLDDIQAAILRVKLRHLDEMNAARADRAATYLARLPAAFRAQQPTNGAAVNNHLFQVRFDGDRDALSAHLDAAGIQNNVYYVIPHHLQEAVAHLGYRPGSLPVTEAVCADAIALPLYPEMPLSVVDRVCAAIAEFMGTSDARTARG